MHARVNGQSLKLTRGSRWERNPPEATLWQEPASTSTAESLLRCRGTNRKPEAGFSPAGSGFMWALLPPHGRAMNSSSSRLSTTPLPQTLSQPFLLQPLGAHVNETPKLLPYEEDSKELEAPAYAIAVGLTVTRGIRLHWSEKLSSILAEFWPDFLGITFEIIQRTKQLSINTI